MPEGDARENLAYLAGVLDSEGCARINIDKYGRANIYVRIFNTFEPLIDYIDLNFPGYRYTRGALKDYPNYSDCHSISWYGQNAIDVLELLQPYLIVKKEQARIIIEFYSVCVKNRAYSCSSAITEAELIVRNSYKEKVHRLNCRGRFKDGGD